MSDSIENDETDENVEENDKGNVIVYQAVNEFEELIKQFRNKKIAEIKALVSDESEVERWVEALDEELYEHFKGFPWNK